MLAARRQFLQFSASAIAATAYASIAHAQVYPSKPITLIVPFPPGGSTDVVGRIVAERMRPLLGQPLVIENVGGAGGSIALGRVARASPDGYTIDIGQWDTHVGGIIYNINYNLQTDFTPIGLMTINPQLMVARKNLPADDLKGLVAYMKANPGKALLANQTAAAQTSGIQLQALTGTTLQLIPYRGAGPEIPTADESGVRGLYTSGWFGLFAPKGTPNDAIGKLNGAMVETLADPAIRARLAELGLDVASREQQTPQGLAEFYKAEVDKWWPILKAANIKGE